MISDLWLNIDLNIDHKSEIIGGRLRV